MSVTDKDVIDSVAYEEEKSLLILQIYDHLDFEGKFEYDHLVMLQDKLNTYLWYINSKQYNDVYPEKEFDNFVINIYFMCEMTELCKKFIDNANKRLFGSGIRIVTYFSPVEIVK